MDETVLVVDDERAIVNSLRRLFAHSGLQVLGSQDGGEALKILNENEVAVLVSDNRMPGMAGVELLSRVPRVSPATVSILLTGHADFSAAMDAVNRGSVFRLMLKPWDDNTMIRAVLDAAKRWREQQSSRSGPGRLTSLNPLSASEAGSGEPPTPSELPYLQRRRAMISYSAQERLGELLRRRETTAGGAGQMSIRKNDDRP
ncbi:MAG: response regulator [Deltaproteobacteria bacterium]|nr:response regulator [Deltaproteobacteria bacterium]